MSREYKSVGESMSEGGPAFPGKVMNTSFAGMTLRDYFAAQVVQGFLAGGKDHVRFSDLSVAAYSMADAMLEARK